MSPRVNNRSISRQRLMQMLSRRAPGVSEPISGAPDAPLLDWTSPHHFDPHAWQQMQNLGKRMASSIESTLGPICLEEPKVRMSW